MRCVSQFRRDAAYGFCRNTTALGHIVWRIFICGEAFGERMGVEVFRDMREGLEGADIVMMLRLQRERMNGSFVPSTAEYFQYFGLDQKKLNYAKPDALVMHPGPMNRGVEIDSIVADGAQSLIREQVEMGVAVRMAVLEALARNLPNA